jgi:Fe-S cluster biosynthesis and repair protein YggX
LLFRKEKPINATLGHYQDGRPSTAGILKGMSTQPQTAQRMVFCVKLQREMEGLSEVPFDGHPLGQRIYDNVSKQAWGMWVEHMKMLMNEYRLNLGTKEAQEFLLQQMEQYFFGEGSAPPPEFVATPPH